MKSLNIYIKQSVILILLTIYSLTIHAGSSTLIVGRGNGHYPPFEVMNSDGTLGGFHIELVRAVAARLNMEVEFQSLPWKRALYFLQQGRLDAVTYMGKTEEREKYAIYLDGNRISYSVKDIDREERK